MLILLAAFKHIPSKLNPTLGKGNQMPLFNLCRKRSHIVLLQNDKMNFKLFSLENLWILQIDFHLLFLWMWLLFLLDVDLSADYVYTMHVYSECTDTHFVTLFYRSYLCLVVCVCVIKYVLCVLIKVLFCGIMSLPFLMYLEFSLCFCNHVV